MNPLVSHNSGCLISVSPLAFHDSGCLISMNPFHDLVCLISVSPFAFHDSGYSINVSLLASHDSGVNAVGMYCVFVFVQAKCLFKLNIMFCNASIYFILKAIGCLKNFIGI